MTKVQRIVRAVLHEAHHYVHITYLVLVFVESHGMYGIAAGVLGTIVLIDGHIERKLKRAAKEEE